MCGSWTVDISTKADTGEVMLRSSDSSKSLVKEARPELVYHLAAEFGRRNGEDFYETMWRANAVGTKNLLTLQRSNRFRSIVFSSSEVYGDYDGIMEEDV